MDAFATKPDSDRQQIIQEAAIRHDVNSIIMEKDFWVCWTLKKLFSIADLAPHLIFKGGTSLSKAYKIIERFSEDVDLTISRTAPSIRDGKNPTEEGISNKERERRLKTLTQNAELFVQKLALPKLEETMQNSLKEEQNWQLALDDKDGQTILFYYPSGKEPSPTYIQKNIRLEFGARGETEPYDIKAIRPYVVEEFPNIFSERTVDVPTLAVERTFWEKATILHALHHGVKLRDRMSRHYYDVYMLLQRGVADAALDIPELLEQVVNNKSLFFRDAKASYGTAKIGSLRLQPKSESIPELKKDYVAMDEMFMGKHPSFEEIVGTLMELESRINHPSPYS